MKRNCITWLCLMSFTLAGWSISATEQRTNAPWIILMVALVKAIMVGWRFMEIHAAHMLWKFSFFTLSITIIGVLCILL